MNDLENQKGIIMGYEPKMINSKITFEGENNILFCEENVTLRNSQLKFRGNNSLIYLSSNKNSYMLNVDIYNNSVLFMDENTYMNGVLNIIQSEEKNVIIGKDCLFSFGIWMRLADPHLIYDCESKKRLNLSESIYIGDHVWIGQNSMILKGSKIGSGSIIGAMSLCSNKKIPSNTSWGGAPAKKIKEGVFFASNCVHKYTEKETANSMIYNTENYIYKQDSNSMKFEDIENQFTKKNSIEEKLEYVKAIRNNKEKNRFSI